MLTDNTKQIWTARGIAAAAIVLASVGGLWVSNKINRAAEPRAAVTTSCSGFEAAALKLFEKGDTATLTGTFAPGDHVHLEIDFKGVGYSWELTGALGKAPLVTSTGPFTFTYSNTRSTVTLSPPSKSAVSHGTIDGFAKLELDVDVTTAGEGVLTINKTSSMSLLPSPSVVHATCDASNEAEPLQRGVVSSSGSARHASAQPR
jgi:hypothetical protein